MGPISAAIRRSELVLDALAGPDDTDFATARCPRPAPRAGSLDAHALRGARFGIIAAHLFPDAIDPVVAASFDEAVARLKGAGAFVELCRPPVTIENVDALLREPASTEGARPSPFEAAVTLNALFRYFERQGGDAEARFWRGLPAYAGYYDALPTDRREIASAMRAPYEWNAAGIAYLARRDQVVGELTRFLDEHRYAALIAPSLFFRALPIGAAWPKPDSALGMADMLGLPKISVPIRLAADGRPAGNLSILGRPFSDVALANFAHAFGATAPPLAPPL